MKLALKIFGSVLALFLALLLTLALLAGGWYVYKKQPQRSGSVTVPTTRRYFFKR